MDRKKMHKSKGKWVTISTSLVASLMVGASAQTIASAQEDASIYTYTEDEMIAENQTLIKEDTYVEPEAEWVEYSTEAPAVVEEIIEATLVADSVEASTLVQNMAPEPEVAVEMTTADTAMVEEQANQAVPVVEEVVESEAPVEEAEVTEPAADIELPTNSESIETVVNPETVVDADELVEETDLEETPETETPVDEAELEVTPEAETPVDEAELEVTPEAETPVEETDLEATPETEAPVDEAELEVTPEAETPVDEAELEVTPEAETPVEETDLEVTPEAETPVEETDLEVTPEAEAPVEEAEVTEPAADIELPTNSESIETVVNPETVVDADELVEETDLEVTPETETPVEETDLEPTPETEAPAEEVDLEATPEAEAPVDEAELEVTPETEAPAEEVDLEATPEAETPVEEVSEEAPVKDAPEIVAPKALESAEAATEVTAPKPETPTKVVMPTQEPIEVPTKPVQAESKVETKTQSEPTTQPAYTISQGDTLWSLARKNNVSVSQLKEWNNLSNDSIIANASLIVANPTSNAVTSNDQKRQTEMATKPASNTAASQQSSAYTISAGDTLYSIARRNNVSVANLRAWNNLTSDMIYTNGNLIVANAAIPANPTKPVNPTTPTNTDNTSSYKVNSGDTLWSIARRNNVSVAQLQEWNNLSSHSIFANQNLIVNRANNAEQPSSGGSTTAPTETNTKTHTVNRGEYLYAIARQHGVTVNQLREWNKLSGDNVHPNDRLVVSKPGTATGGNSNTAKPEEKPADQDSPAADNANKQAVIDWFKEREGKVTYSMTNRMGPDSYDCSSAVFFALMEAGYLPDGTWPGTTESLYALEGSLFSPISRDEVQAGDIFVAGHKGFSLGSGGHTGVAVSNSNIIHSNYSDNGISTTPIEGYTSYAGMPTYWYRLMEN